MGQKTILLSSVDHSRLRDLVGPDDAPIVSGRRELDALRAELNSAKVVAPDKMPNDVVTMNSTVVLRDIETDERETYTLVFPDEADASKGRMSILAPLAIALLGYRVGDVVAVRGGHSQVEVESLTYQPERAGDFDR